MLVGGILARSILRLRLPLRGREMDGRDRTRSRGLETGMDGWMKERRVLASQVTFDFGQSVEITKTVQHARTRTQGPQRGTRARQWEHETRNPQKHLKTRNKKKVFTYGDRDTESLDALYCLPMYDTCKHRFSTRRSQVLFSRLARARLPPSNVRFPVLTSQVRC